MACYLPACLSSLAKQAHPQTRVLLIDDGSTDGSEAIARQFASSNANFVYERKVNGGLGSARNLGLELASSEFVMFVDGDDTVAPDYVSSMVAAVEGHDLAVCGIDLVDGHGKLIARKEVGTLANEVDPIQAILDSGNECYSVNKIFRLQRFRDKNVRFGSKLFEDLAAIPALVANATSVGFVAESKYYYLQHPGSIIAGLKRNPERCLEIFSAVDQLIEYRELFLGTRWSDYRDGSLMSHMFLSRAWEINLLPNGKEKAELVRKHSHELSRRFPRWADTKRVREWINRGRNPLARAARRIFVEGYRSGKPEFYLALQELQHMFMGQHSH